jgi:hypothetical protein
LKITVELPIVVVFIVWFLTEVVLLTSKLFNTAEELINKETFVTLRVVVFKELTLHLNIPFVPLNPLILGNVESPKPTVALALVLFVGNSIFPI